MNTHTQIAVQPRRKPYQAAQAAVARGQVVSGAFASSPVLGVDASVAKVGFALMFQNRVLAWVYRPKSQGLARLRELRAEAARIVGLYDVQHAVIEGYSMGSRDTHAHSTGEAGGVIRLSMLDAGCYLWESAPQSMKKFVSGKGVTPKSGIPLALFKRYGVELSQEDEADAASLAVMCAQRLDFPGNAALLPGFQTEALSALSDLVDPSKTPKPQKRKAKTKAE